VVNSFTKFENKFSSSLHASIFAWAYVFYSYRI